MHTEQWFNRFNLWYYLILALLNLIMFVWVTIKICRTTRSVFALTLLSFTPLLAITLIYYAVANFWFNKWVRFICQCFTASLPMQSWFFAMQYFKSYLYTCASADSIKYKIHTVVKYTIIVAYVAVLIYFTSRVQSSYRKFDKKIQ